MLYPLFLKVEGRAVLVVGAGVVAERKIGELLEAKAQVRCVAPEATQAIVDWAREGHVAWEARRFSASDVNGVWFAIAATADPKTQRAVFRAAEKRHAFVVAVDDPANASAYSGSVVRRDPYVIAISSTGQAPALTRMLREVLEQILPDEQWVDAARVLRAKWRKDGTPMASRFGELVHAFKSRQG